MAPTWASGDKDLIGGSLGPARLWFTVGGGIVNEVFWPRVDIPQVRDLGFIIADGKGFWVEAKRLPERRVGLIEPGVPVVEVAHRHERFTLRLRLCADPLRDVLLIAVDLEGDQTLRPYVLLAPRLGGRGEESRAWVGTHRGQRVLWAEQGPFGLALLASAQGRQPGFGRASAGYAGASDGWQDFSANGALVRSHEQAGPGNVTLTGEINPWTTLALGFAASKESAATLAATALEQRFEDAVQRQGIEWRAWHGRCEAQRVTSAALPGPIHESLTNSAMVLRTHMDRTFPGAVVTSLSVPWGSRRSDRGGYNLVRPRDLAEAGSALLALGALEEAREVLRHLVAIQEPDGHWHGSQWLGGKPCQALGPPADTAYPVLLASALAERGALEGVDVEQMVTRALGHLLARGPAGWDPDRQATGRVDAHTLAVGVAALVTGARFLSSRARAFALTVADFWNGGLDSWAVARDTPLCRSLGVRAYYRSGQPGPGPAGEESVGTDFLSVVRLGLRRPEEPLVLDSLRVVDALLRVQTPAGPTWRRYLGDRHGEDEAGLPLREGGRGHGWPLLTGERGHYELAHGRDPLPFLEAIVAMAGPGGLLPEQVWDGAPAPEVGLRPGGPTGSAMPLARAHAEFVKLALSRALGRPVDRPAAVWRRYQTRHRVPESAVWTPHAPLAAVEPGQRLLVCTPRPARLHYGVNGWRRIADVDTTPTGLGLHAAELAGAELAGGHRLSFTWQWTDTGHWCGRDYSVSLRFAQDT
jgi:glucoamylase